MTIVNTHEAKTQLSRLLVRVQMGEEITIARAGKPIARLVPASSAPLPRQPGSAKGMISIAPDFDAPLADEIIAEFEGAP